MPSPEDGSGSVLAVGLVAGIVCLSAVALPLYSLLATRSALAGAADAAALAAADARVGVASGYPCDRAAELAGLNGAELVDCEVDGLVATVSVGRSILGFELRATASAGPAPETGD